MKFCSSYIKSFCWMDKILSYNLHPAEINGRSQQGVQEWICLLLFLHLFCATATSQLFNVKSASAPHQSGYTTLTHPRSTRMSSKGGKQEVRIFLHQTFYTFSQPLTDIFSIRKSTTTMPTTASQFP